MADPFRVEPRRLLGLAGEHLAERELACRGFRVIARNVRTRFGEIDLICRDARGYAFVEVKTRRAGSFVAAAEAVDARKAARLAALAQGWLAHRGERDAVWRIVIAALTVGADGTRVELVDLDR
ncbi:MAG TPA: YraN family protein [Candidatus Limnocylindria bacterium]